MHKHPRSTDRFRRYAMAGVILLAAAGPALALSLKGIMQRMSDTTSVAKANLSNFDARTAEDVLRRYVEDARNAKTLFASGQSARDQDLRARFDKMAAVADASNRQKLDQASFRKAFLAVATECRSCHSAHK